MGHKKKGSESSPMKAQMEAGRGDKEEEQDLHHDSEYTNWEEIVPSDAEEEGAFDHHKVLSPSTHVDVLCLKSSR
jgi:hypothetical protein